MSEKKGAYLIPFLDGVPQHYPESWHKNMEWRDNKPFHATFNYTGYGRGRSSATIHFCDDAGVEYEMFMTHFDKIARNMCYGTISGYWDFIKCGQNYGVKYIGATPS
jgi:hypothetical protein